MEMVYAGFWRRFAAMWIDAVLTIPVTFLSIYFLGLLKLPYVIGGLLGLFFFVWYSVYLVHRYGGTPGKLLMGVRITMLSGEKISERATWLRSSIWLCTSILSVLALTLASQKISLSEYLAFDFFERAKKLEELTPNWYGFLKYFDQLWFWSEFLTMHFNKKRRALHDFMAGTVVIRIKKPVASELT
jgi:uncharacterized RDD family membrane protein YckC